MTDKEILKTFNRSRKKELSRIIVRPKFTLYKELLQIVGVLTIICVTIIYRNNFSGSLLAILLCMEFVLFVVTQTKNILLILIFCYQRFAPRIIRAACLFTPSCSEYMRLSIIKYGVFTGIKRGFKRLKRCRPPNGGIDEP